jgi:hypothetical protein
MDAQLMMEFKELSAQLKTRYLAIADCYKKMSKWVPDPGHLDAIQDSIDRMLADEKSLRQKLEMARLKAYDMWEKGK